MGSSMIVTALPSRQFVQLLCEKIEKIGRQAIQSRGKFILGVSGGSMISLLEGLPLLVCLNWSFVKIILCDERLVPEEDPESTYGCYMRKVVPKLEKEGFRKENFINANTTMTPKESAQDYEKKLKDLWTHESSNDGVDSAMTPQVSAQDDKNELKDLRTPESSNYGIVDLLLLGVGPDGHTCSLFPGHSVLDVTDSWVTCIEDSPKPPPKRITLTYPFLNKAANIFVVGKGKEKWDILEKIKNGEDYPVGRVQNPDGRLEWVLEELPK